MIRDLAARLTRKPDSHKGDFGRIFILAGSEGMTGAAHLSAMAALKSGAGLVTAGVPQKVYPVIARRELEVMVRPFPSTSSGTLAVKGLKQILSFSKNQDVLAVGPGLSQNKETQKLIRNFIEKTSQPLVLDADGLNAFEDHSKALRACSGRAVLTPHAGEFQRLFGKKPAPNDKDRIQKSLLAAKNSGAIIVLKGFRTIVAGPAGKVYVNTTGNPGMATAGTGDVLTGIIAALIGQKLSLWDAARLGVYIHGLAGDLAARKIGQISLTARDLLEYLPAAFRKIKV